LIEDNFGLGAHCIELFLPSFGDLGNLCLELTLAIFCLFDIKGCDGRVEALGIFLCFHDQLALLVHELVETLVLLDLKDEDVRGLLRLTELGGKLASVVACLHTQII